MLYPNINSTIGNTPVVKLNRLSDSLPGNVYVKLEWFNPGGSVKDRIALSMVEAAEQDGTLKKGDTIVEPTSGNTGIGLALVSAAKGYRLVVTMPDTVSVERRKIMKAYGATLVLTDGTKGMKGAIAEAEKLVNEHGYFFPMQFENENNPKIHAKTTAREIVNDFDALDYVVVGVGTGGTLTGIGKVLKEHYPTLSIKAVEPDKSAVLSGKEPGPHKIQGIGAGFIPAILDTKIYDEALRITEEEAIETARRLAQEEGILGGISTGANVAAALKVARKAKEGDVVLTFSPSNGERYLSTDLYE